MIHRTAIAAFLGLFALLPMRAQCGETGGSVDAACEQGIELLQTMYQRYYSLQDQKTRYSVAAEDAADSIGFLSNNGRLVRDAGAARRELDEVGPRIDEVAGRIVQAQNALAGSSPACARRVNGSVLIMATRRLYDLQDQRANFARRAGSERDKIGFWSNNSKHLGAVYASKKGMRLVDGQIEDVQRQIAALDRSLGR